MTQIKNIAAHLDMMTFLRDLRNGSFITVEKEGEHKMRKVGNPFNGRKVVKHSVFQLQVGCNTQNIENKVAIREGRAPRVIGALPWGEYLEGLPIITHKGSLYLRGHWVKSLYTTYTIDGKLATPDEKKRILEFSTSKPLDKQTALTIKLDNIKRLSGGGQTITA